VLSTGTSRKLVVEEEPAQILAVHAVWHARGVGVPGHEVGPFALAPNYLCRRAGDRGRMQKASLLLEWARGRGRPQKSRLVGTAIVYVGVPFWTDNCTKSDILSLHCDALRCGGIPRSATLPLDGQEWTL
jgi:hypothetical protein